MHEYRKCRNKLNIIEAEPSQFQQIFQYRMAPYQLVRLKQS